MSDEVAPTAGFARRTLLLVALCALGALGGLLAWPEPQAHAARPTPVLLAGVPIAPAADPKAAARELAERYFGGRIALRTGGTELVLRRADLGVSVDLGRLERQLAAAADPLSP